MDGFKQRIFGALIIVSLAVIFLPMMFDEPHEERTSQSIDIPDQPTSPDAAIDEPREPEPVDEPPPPEMSEAPETPETVDAPEPEQEPEKEPEPRPESPEPEETADTAPEPDEAPDSAALEGSYLVQLASFGSSDNAQRFRDQVRDEGFEAYVEEFTRDDDVFHRVFAGPFIDRDEAESAKSELDESLSIDGMVVAAGE